MYAFQDYVQNGRGFGEVGQLLQGVHFDPHLLRPYWHKGQQMVTYNTGRRVANGGKDDGKWILREAPIADLRARHGWNIPVWNATSLRKEEWVELDKTVRQAARPRLKAWSDLSSRSSISGFNAMGKTVYEYETSSDPGFALVDMDGVKEAWGDEPQFQLQAVPLPITHSGFQCTSRRLATSKGNGQAFDTRMGEAAGRRVGEAIERTLIGVQTGVAFGGTGRYDSGMAYGRASQVYGYTNFPSRLTKTNLVSPSSGSWTPDDTVDDVLAMIDQLTANFFYGPFMLYHSNDWDRYMNGDYYRMTTSGAVAPTKTLKERLKAIDDIIDVKRLDFLTSSALGVTSPYGPTTANPFTLIMVQMTKEVVVALNGMDVTTVQWEEKGGMLLKFKVMAIQVPLIQADFYGNCGLIHGTTS
ncbi:MAG TPA: major capsid protein [Aquabacterium sp.]|nr:major capsid protein [Aquabacterium sp.]